MTINEQRQYDDLERAVVAAIEWLGDLLTGRKLKPTYGTAEWRKEVGAELGTLVECVQLMCWLYCRPSA